MYAEASACKCAQNVNFRAKMIAPRVGVLIKKACSHQCEEHSPDSRLGEIALLHKLGEPGARRACPPDQEQQSRGAINALSSAGSGLSDHLHSFPRRCAL
jgi:hypothetical protein